MKRIIHLLVLFLLSNFALASEGFINLNAFMGVNPDIEDSLRPDDIGYLYTAPQYEENQDSTNPVVVEYYFGSYDDSSQSKASMEYLSELISDERKANKNFHPEILSISTKKTSDTEALDEIVKSLNLFHEIYFSILTLIIKESQMDSLQDKSFGHSLALQSVLFLPLQL